LSKEGAAVSTAAVSTTAGNCTLALVFFGFVAVFGMMTSLARYFWTARV
jgi:hypothetical protein